MRQLRLSETEKRLLRHLSHGAYDRSALPELSDIALYAAGKRLGSLGLIYAMPNSGELLDAMIKPEGEAYLEEYPDLADPINVDIEELTRKNLILQNKELEYKEKIRKQEKIIRWWQVITAIIGAISLIIAFLKL